MFRSVVLEWSIILFRGELFMFLFVLLIILQHLKHNTSSLTEQPRLNSFRTMIYGQRHAKRDFWTYAKSVDPDQPPRLRPGVWSRSALFDTRHINGTYFPCGVNNLIAYKCYQHRIGADLGLHYVKYPKVPFRVTLAIKSVCRNQLKIYFALYNCLFLISNQWWW